MEEGRVCLPWETGRERRRAELALKCMIPKSHPGLNYTRSALEIPSNH